MTDKSRSYYNTLIFTIVAAIVSLLLLLLLLIKKMRQFLPFIITLEIGIFTVIVWCIVVIWVNSKSANDERENATTVKFDSCPDYFIKVNENDKIMCKNQYMYTDQNGVNYKMVIYPLGTGKELPTNLTSVIANPTNLDAFELTAIDKSTDLKSSKEKCAVLMKGVDKNSIKESPFQYYNTLPWNTMQSKCASIYS